MEKLSSGFRINRAADDAAGLGISEKMRGQIGGLAQAQRNVQDGISLVQTAEGALGEVHCMLQRVRDLKVQFENGTNDGNDKPADHRRGAARSPRKSLDPDRHRVQRHRRCSTNPRTLQVGANEGETITVAATNLTAQRCRRRSDRAHRLRACRRRRTLRCVRHDVDRPIDTMIKNVSAQRGTYGAVQNRLEHRLTNLATYQENLTASESRIRDVDMAAEMTKFTKFNILQQAGTSMLAQANQAPQSVLSLLR